MGESVVSGQMKILALLAIVLVAAGCGGGSSASPRAHTVTFSTAGAFPTLTIAGKYSPARCRHDSGTIVQNARLFYKHSTTLPGPADLYYYDMREGYAYFQADGCLNAQLGAALTSGLTARQRTWLLANLPADFERIFSAALAAASR